MLPPLVRPLAARAYQANTRAHLAAFIASRAAKVNTPTPILPTRANFVHRANTPIPQARAFVYLVLQAKRQRGDRARARNVRLAPSRRVQAVPCARLVTAPMSQKTRA